MGIDPVPKYKSQARDYMATFLDGLRQFFRDFRQFVVMASRKFRLTPGISNPTASWPALHQGGRQSRPSAPRRRGVDGRDTPGHDGETMDQAARSFSIRRLIVIRMGIRPATARGQPCSAL